MAIVEDVTDDEIYRGDPGPSSSAELLKTLGDLTSRLSVPDELLPSFLQEDKREL